MNEKELKNNDESTDIYNNENMTKIFENQRVTLNKDIIFLKEDILKDFKTIEANLNLKYEKQNSNITNKLHKFESSIEAMKSKIEELSSLISTDTNIQQKVLQLTDFKRKAEDKIINLEVYLKLNLSELKESISRYDKLITESIIYPGIIGSNARFKTFHEMIDFILAGIHQITFFKEKNNIDEEYAIKMEKLYKSIKTQTDFIITSCNDYCSKTTGELLTKFEKLVYSQESKLGDFKKENDNYIRNIEDRITNINDLIKNINNSKEVMNNVINNEIKKYEEYKEKTDKQLETFIKEIELIKNKNINNKKEINKENILQNKENNQNLSSRKNLRKTQLGTSIIKKYIIGEISYNDIEKSHLNKLEKLQKRLTLEPEKLKDVFEKKFTRKNTDIIKKETENISNIKTQKDDDAHLSNIKTPKDNDAHYSSSFDKSENKSIKSNKSNKSIKSSKNLRNKNETSKQNILNEEEKIDGLYSTKKKSYKLLVFQNPNENPLNKIKINKNNERNNIIYRDKIIKKMGSIGNNHYNIINYNYNKNKKLIRNSSARFYNKIKNNKYDNYRIFNDFLNIQIKNNENKLNVIEVNFDKKYEANKEKDELQNLIKKIKEKKRFGSEGNNFKKKNKVKLSKSDISINNNLDSRNRDKLIKEEILNYKSFPSSNNFNTSKNSSNKRFYLSKNKQT